jgi:Flp pilus assembly protein TadG
MPIFPRLSALTRFAREERGAAVLVFGLAAVPLVAFTSAAVDFTRAAKARARLQMAVDEAVIAGAKANSVSRSQAVFNGAPIDAGTTVTNSSFVPVGTSTIRGTATASVPFSFGSAFGMSAMTVAARAEAERRATGRACILLLEPTGTETLRLNGSTEVRAPNCEVHLHTVGQPAAIFNGGITFDVKRVCLKSRQYIANGQSDLGPIETNCQPSPDPFVNQIPAPTNMACQYNSFDPGSSKNITMSPGVYCGEVKLNGNPDITLSPGLYVLKNSKWITGGSITGVGVTFYFADSNSFIQINGNSRMELSAPTTGDQWGVLFYEPNGLSRSQITFNGGQNQPLKGLIYLPSRDVTYNGSSSLSSDELTMVLNTLLLNGASNWNLDTSERTIAAGGSSNIVLKH